MPHDNRVMTSSTLQTSSVWTNVIKYDPYASTEGTVAGAAAPASDKLIEQSKGLMELAKLQAGTAQSRSTCRRCGGTGHFTHECRNALTATGQAKKYEEIPEMAVTVLPPQLAVSATGLARASSSADVVQSQDRDKDKDRERGRESRRHRSRGRSSSSSSSSSSATSSSRSSSDDSRGHRRRASSGRSRHREEKHRRHRSRSGSRHRADDRKRDRHRDRSRSRDRRRKSSSREKR